jgi:DNA-binding transcriptional LysR family regulator
VRLFERTGAGLVLTPTGVTLYEQARAMEEASLRLSLAAAGQGEVIAGPIRITASEVMSALVLPELLTQLRALEPSISIELLASDQTDNLLQREADIAVRMFRPTQTELVARMVGKVSLGMYAAPAYLARSGMPQHMQDLLGHTVIGDDRSSQILEGFRSAGLEVNRHFFAFRCDSRLVQWRMVLAGFGVGFMQRNVGDVEAGAVAVLTDVVLPELPIWLTAHAELRTSRRIRRVYDFLAAALAAKFGQ